MKEQVKWHSQLQDCSVSLFYFWSCFAALDLEQEKKKKGFLSHVRTGSSICLWLICLVFLWGNCLTLKKRNIMKNECPRVQGDDVQVTCFIYANYLRQKTKTSWTNLYDWKAETRSFQDQLYISSINYITCRPIATAISCVAKSRIKSAHWLSHYIWLANLYTNGCLKVAIGGFHDWIQGPIHTPNYSKHSR